ncbi:MAG: hypothetical protein ACLQUY_09075 [Ktedonobacterales bacterium]
MLLLGILVLALPLVVLSLVAWRFGADSRDWRNFGEWDWLHRPVPDGTDRHD